MTKRKIGIQTCLICLIVFISIINVVAVEPPYIAPPKPPISFSQINSNPTTVYAGETFTPTVSLKNDGSLNIICNISDDVNGFNFKELIVNPGAIVTVTSTKPIIPIFGQNVYIQLYSKCKYPTEELGVGKFFEIHIEVKATEVMKAQWAAQAADEAALNNARSKANTAMFPLGSAIIGAQDAINEAKNIGADVTNAQTNLDLAISKQSLAKAKIQEGTTYLGASRNSDAISAYNQAESYANEALTATGNAKDIAIQSKEKYNSPIPTPVVQTTEQVNIPIATSTPYVVQTIAQGIDRQVNIPSANPTPGFGLLLMIVTMGIAIDSIKRKK